MSYTSIYMESTLPHTTTRWEQLNWSHINRYVERLQQRIFRAESQGHKRRVRNLQRLLIRSKATLLLAIRRVTQINKGKKTAGIDGETALTPKERIKLFREMERLEIEKHNPKPSYRTYIKKKNGKMRPLSIPIIRDRIYQFVIKSALEPQWEQRFEPISYGFRPKRSCHDAIKRIFLSCHSGKSRWIFEGDFKGCFDNLKHEYILEKIKDFPQRSLIEKWLKAGYVDNNVFNETTEGSGQGSIVSPLLANIALMGMEEALGIKYKVISKNGKEICHANTSKYTLVFYADDFVVICQTKADAEDVFNLIFPYLKARGLSLSEEKTKVTSIDKGFDFLGFNIRLYNTCQGEKLFIIPSNESIKKAKENITNEVKKLKGANVNALISKLNPIIIGIGNYWSPWVSKHAYNTMDYHIINCTSRFLRKLHSKKTAKWICNRYYKPDKTGQSKDKWILTCPLERKQMTRMSWIPIIRHSLIRFKASPYNLILKEYYEERDKKEFNRNSIKSRQKLCKQQNYKCTICDCSVADFADKLTVKEKIPITQGGVREYKNLELVHRNCYNYFYKRFPSDGEPPSKADMISLGKETKRLRLAGML
jgi:RNA-directed DNA polymerase